MTLKEKLHLAEQRLPLPALAQSLGFFICERPGTCRSPFREERKPSLSWCIAQDGRARTGKGSRCSARWSFSLRVICTNPPRQIGET